MPPIVALTLTILFCTWLCIRERKFGRGVSGATWIPLAWFFIVASRPVTNWLSLDSPEYITPQDLLEGSPLDAAVYAALLAAGLCVLATRFSTAWRTVTSNRAFCAFLLFGLASTLWSDYPIVALKRWVKDFGSVVMVVVLLTELDPVQAVRTALLRLTYIAVPLSVAFIKYYPHLGRYTDRWTGDYFFSGITTDKNALGPLALVCGIALAWNLLNRGGNPPNDQARAALRVRTRADADWPRPDASQDEVRRAAPVPRRFTAPEPRFDVIDGVCHVVLLGMVVWLLAMAQSSTSIVCMILSIGILLVIRPRRANFAVRNLGTLTVVALVSVVFVVTQTDLMASFSEVVGRDATLTGRTQLWEDLLAARVNPWLGRGFQSFWLGPEATEMWEKYYFHPNQAHNGYLETYLNGGIIGLAILVVMLIATLRNLKHGLLARDPLAVLCLCYLATAVVSNWTEATFNKLNLIWIFLILATLRASQNVSPPIRLAEPLGAKA